MCLSTRKCSISIIAIVLVSGVWYVHVDIIKSYTILRSASVGRVKIESIYYQHFAWSSIWSIIIKGKILVVIQSIRY